MNASRLYEGRHSGPFLRMFSDFVTRKYSPNILVRFGQTSGPQRQQACQTLRTIVQECYGSDRFVVYPVDDVDLKCDSRSWSAAGILDFSQNSSQNRLDSLNVPSLELRPEILSDETKLRDELFTFFNEHIEQFSSPDVPKLEPEVRQETEIHSLYMGNKTFVASGSLRDLKHLFNFDEYYSTLQTSDSFGRHVRFQEVTSSTMELIKDLKNVNGSVAIANYQLSGIGRNENQWLSPRGCAMWTVNLVFPLSDPLFSRLSLLQHIASLAVLQSIPSYNELGIRIKWPNDIVYKDTLSKLCGMLTKSEFGSGISVQIGIGLNVSNRYPSICLDELVNYRNRCLELNNESTNDKSTNGIHKLELMTRESLIARFMNNFQALLSSVGTDEGLKEFKTMYTQNWIHQGTIVNIEDNRSASTIKRKAEIVDINDQGFLLVRDCDSGLLYDLQSDGNRFDLMNNLVILNK